MTQQDEAATALGRSLGSSLDPTLEAAAAIGAAKAAKVGLNRGALAWALYEGARNPYVILITIYIFSPYFATAVVGDPVRGQTLVASIATFSGLFVALTGPVLGASIDKIGRRKPPLLAVTAIMVPLLFALWWVQPGKTGLGLGVASMILGVLGALFAYSELLHNSLLSRAATPAQAPYASGLGLSLGNFCSLVMLAFVLWAFALPGKVDWSFIPKHPLFGLDPLKHESDRIVGPIVAVFLAIGAIPLFLLTPDASPTRVGLLRALRSGVQGVGATLRTLRGHRAAAVFLGSRMLYTDGMTALLTFAGVYAAGVMHWGTLELLAYGILLSVFAVLGGQVGAWLDARLGPKRAVQIEIVGSIVCLLGQLGMAPNKIFYVIAFDPAAHAPLWNGPMFRTLPEVAYMLVGLGTAVFVTAQYASSRTFLTRLAPPGQTASFFGLYALSGTATAWLGSLLVRIFTGAFKTQQSGFVPIALLLAIGFVGMLFVNNDGREAVTPTP